MTPMKRILTIAAACMLLASCATNAGKNDAAVAEESAPSVAEESVASGAKPQLYDESIDLLAQIDAALKHVAIVDTETVQRAAHAHGNHVHHEL